ncbi:MAG: HDIG domain-containing protein, partial [Chloroflexota bacterium]|nr:HDIG domain-containing protein [Chloroflexota bacterium]
GLRWARRIADELGGSFVALDEEREVGRVVVQHEGSPLWIDVARFRGEAEGEQGATLEEDLHLRDFTVNAIALDPLTGETIDPTGGVADLEEGVLRATGPRALRDDPLRILRAVRLHATHELTIEPRTQQAMRRAVPGLSEVAAERVREEWMRLLAPPGAMARVEMLDELSVLERLLPELVMGKAVTQSQPHSHDVFEHNLLVLDAMENLFPWAESDDFWRGSMARFAEPMTWHLQEEIAHELPRWLLLKHVALLHDIGKSTTRSVGKDGRIHFYRHEAAGAEMIRGIMRRMKFASKAVQYAESVVRHHLRPLQLSNHLPPSRRAIYRFFRDTGDAGPDIALHSVADQRGKAFAEDREEVVAVVLHLFEAYFEEQERFVRPKPLLNGNEVMEITGKQGPIIGKILENLREQQAQGTVQTREEAIRVVQGWNE